MNEPFISVVVASRNDNHGGNMLKRMQLFINGWIEQADRYNLCSELIIVDWNPPFDKPPLVEALQWPRSKQSAVRIITVPPEVHQRFRFADRLPLFQMIAKNVGIRRARGQFILATNIDILFSNELVQYLASGDLDNNRMYRVDRYDVPADIPYTSIDEQLNYCQEHIIRINGRQQTQILKASALVNSSYAKFQSKLHAIRSTGDAFILAKAIALYLYSLPNQTAVGKTVQSILYGKHLHTNACGDFTLMAREHWSSLRGNPEFELFSFYLDGLTCSAAHYGKVREQVLQPPMMVYHIEHGGGWTPDNGIGINITDILQLSYRDYLQYLRRIRWHQGFTVYNDSNWGLASDTLPEIRPMEQ